MVIRPTGIRIDVLRGGHIVHQGDYGGPVPLANARSRIVVVRPTGILIDVLQGRHIVLQGDYGGPVPLGDARSRIVVVRPTGIRFDVLLPLRRDWGDDHDGGGCVLGMSPLLPLVPFP